MTSTYHRWFYLWALCAWLLGCESIVSHPGIDGCPTPDEPYLYPALCSEQIDSPIITRIVFDPPGGKVPLRVRFMAEARAGLREFDNSVRLHWDLDGDSQADATTLSGDAFYFDYETCTTIHFQIWAEDELGKVSEPLKKALFLACNEPPRIFEFSTLIDLGPPGLEVLFTLKAVDPDAEDPELVNGIAKIEWDFDGDGTSDLRTDGRPVVVPQRYVFRSVGIFRPRVRVYDEDGLYTESNRLQIQILGTSSLLQNMYSVVRADAVTARGDLVASFFGSGITMRQFNGTTMLELSQVPLGTLENAGAANIGNLWLVVDAFSGNLRIWNAEDVSTVTATTSSPRLLYNCAGDADYAEAGAVRMDANSVGLTQALVDGEPVTVAVMNRRYNPFIPIDVGEVYLLDLSRHASIPTTDNSSSSCTTDNTDLIPVPRNMRLHNTGLFDAIVPAQQVTAETDIIYAATAYTGFRAYYWPAFWSATVPLPAGVSGTNPPLAAHVQSGYTTDFQAMTVSAAPGHWAYATPARVYAVGATQVTLVLPRYVDFAAPLTVSLDGWAMPATLVSQGAARHELVVSRTTWNTLAMDVSSITVDFLSPAHIVVADASPASANVFVREPGYPLTLTRVGGVGTVNVAVGGTHGKILQYGDWVIHVARGAVSIPANNGLFVAPITRPHETTRIGSLVGGQISDIALTGDYLYVAGREKGVLAYDLSTLSAGFKPAPPQVNARSYLVGSAPKDLALDVTAGSLWVAEGQAGLRRFALQSNDTIAAAGRSGVIDAALGLALDSENRRLYAAGDTEVVAINADTFELEQRVDGFRSLGCVVHRYDGAEQALVLCDRQANQNVRAYLARSPGSGTVLDGPWQSFDTPPEVEGFALGPIDTSEPRLFASSSNGVFVYCIDRSGGLCPESEGGLLTLPQVGISPTVFPYRSQTADLLVAGARNGILSFWDFTALPTLVGMVSMCDPEELWLPASVCQTTDFDTPLDILAMDVVAPYAFLGTSWGLFAIDLRAAPILRTGSFYTGLAIRHVAARYDGNGAYVVYGGTDQGVAVFRFAQFEPAQ